MKLELFYDPIRPETTVRIDGLATDTSDIYGFLYPVRNCIMQTYLYPNGSWTGLKRQIKELSRGDRVEFVFHGRKEDYTDVKAALESDSDITLFFEMWDSEKIIEETFEKLDSLLKKISTDNNADDGVYRKTGRELFPEFFEYLNEIQNTPLPDWKLEINSRSDFLKADKNQGCCCIVGDSFLESYDSFNSLEYLLRSMNRVPEMIICRFEEKDSLDNFAYYTRQFENMNFSLVTLDNNMREKEIYEKYGKPFLIRKRLGAYIRINGILQELAQKRKDLTEEKKAIKRSGDATAASIRKEEQCRAKINWITRKEIYFSEFSKLVESGSNEELSEKGEV